MPEGGASRPRWRLLRELRHRAGHIRADRRDVHGGRGAPARSHAYAVDPKGAEQLWTLSERLLDLTFL